MIENNLKQYNITTPTFIFKLKTTLNNIILNQRLGPVPGNLKFYIHLSLKNE